MKQGKILLVAAALTALFCLAMNAAAYAEDCPAGASTCKVLVLTTQEEQTLTNSIFPAALWANRTFTDLIEAWKQKLAAAPAGTVKPTPDANANPAKKQDKLPQEAPKK